MNAAIPTSLAGLLAELGGVAFSRLRLSPAPTEFTEERTIKGGVILPGFEAKVADVFTDLDFRRSLSA